MLPLATAGALDAAGLLRLLEGLGLEPTQRSVAALMQELARHRKHRFGVVFLDDVTSGLDTMGLRKLPSPLVAQGPL